MNPPSQTDDKACINFGEARGARKRNRYLATKARQEAAKQRSERLAIPPSTAVEAASRWDDFYKTKPTLFKDRHVLRSCFPELVDESVAANPRRHVPRLKEDLFLRENHTNDTSHLHLPDPSNLQLAAQGNHDLVLLEAGCGTGNTLFPILRANTRLYALAFDFSQHAVDLVKQNSEYRVDRSHAFTADVTDTSTYEPCVKAVRPDGVDFVTTFWTLSALDRKGRKMAAEGLANQVRPGGFVFVRDYATGDMREHKFAERGQHVQDGTDNSSTSKLDDTNSASSRLFLRGDGTYAYFFEKDELKSLFQEAGLVCDSCEYEDRVVENRKDSLVMRRRWIQAKFRKLPESD